MGSDLAEEIAALEADVARPIEELQAEAEVEAVLQELEDNGLEGPLVRAHYNQVLEAQHRIGLPTDPATVIGILRQLGEIHGGDA